MEELLLKLNNYEEIKEFSSWNIKYFDNGKHIICCSDTKKWSESFSNKKFEHLFELIMDMNKVR